MYHTLSKLFCLVTIARRSHLFPCRTQKLSSLAPMVVGLTFRKSRTLPGNISLFHSSSVVELSAVNRSVVGSSPTCGAIWPRGQAVKTPPFHGGNTGSSPVGVIFIHIGGLAQLGEHLPYKQGVGGSNPSSSTIANLIMRRGSEVAKRGGL